MQHSLCILSGEQEPERTIIKITLRKGRVSIRGFGFKNGYGESQPQGMMHQDCVYSGSQTSVSDQRLKTDASALDVSLLLEFCNSLSPSMYSQTDLTPQPRLRLIAQYVETALTNHSLPKSPFITKLYQALGENGDMQELMG